MSRVIIAKKRKPVKKRFAGICNDAQVLGVSQHHLWSVLTGRRVSKRLKNRYTELKGLSK